jgi:hypothetical protein
MAAVEEAGEQLAVLTSLVRLLELKLAELEGEGGTGPLEDDVSLLEAASKPGGSHVSVPLYLCFALLPYCDVPDPGVYVKCLPNGAQT